MTSDRSPSARRTFAVVLNWNRPDATLRCVEALRRSRPAPPEVIVVDNGSVDDSCRRLREGCPEVELIETGANLGYAGGNNRGIERALERGAERVVLLNNDDEVGPDCLSRLEAGLDAGRDVGAVGPVVEWPSDGGKARIWAAGGKLEHRENITRLRGFGQVRNGQFSRDEDVDYLPGCVLMVRREAFERVGLLDDTYFCYMEDVDFGRRLAAAGYRNRLVAGAHAVHEASTSTGGGYTPARKYMNAVNSVRFLRRHGSPRAWIGFFVFDVLGLPAALVLATLRGRPGAAWAKARGIVDGLRGIRVTPERVERYLRRDA
ncbi:MAG: glycosyltransferase family 2 protein [Planctomycetota bacterium JB042]